MTHKRQTYLAHSVKDVIDCKPYIHSGIIMGYGPADQLTGVT